LAAEYQELTRILCDLSWSGWRGCYVIFHVKPLVFGRIRAHVIVYFGHVRAHIIDDLVS
jgi:hypothetical protein